LFEANSKMMSEAKRGSVIMNLLLTDFLKQLELQPGESRCVSVEGYEVEVRRPTEAQQDDAMVNLRQRLPFSDRAITLIVQRGEPQLPAPSRIDESDLAPE
jgi:hypothetical protein